MELEKISIELRPRSGWEAIDLGFRMARHWAGPLWRVWFAVFVPVSLALLWAFPEHPMLASALIWWLKPVFDRYLLHVLSRAVFGEVPSVAQTLAASKSILRPGLFWSLLSRFWDFRRSFNLPVTQLEQQTGRPARQRRNLLNQRAGGYALGLTFVCMHFEWVVIIGLAGMNMLFATDVQWQSESPSGSPFLAWANEVWTLQDAVMYLLAISLIEPLFVAGGFALYLNRRVTLEGWDLELAIKRMSAKFASKASTVPALLLALGLACTALSPQARAEAEPTAAAERSSEQAQLSAKAQVQAIVADPVFGSRKQVMRWRSKNVSEVKSERSRPASQLVSAIGEVLRVLSWLLIAVLVIALIAALAGAFRRAPPKGGFEAAPMALFGLDIHPDSLPDDVPAAARAALAEGKIRAALSLLYRGVLAELVHRRQLKLRRGSTEYDVLRLAQGQGLAKAAGFLQQLLPAWVAVAYAARLPDLATAHALCDAYQSALPAAGNGAPSEQTGTSR